MNKIAIHISKNYIKKPEALFSIYFILGKKYGISWKGRNGNIGIRLVSHSDKQGWYKINTKNEPTIRWVKTIFS